VRCVSRSENYEVVDAIIIISFYAFNARHEIIPIQTEWQRGRRITTVLEMAFSFRLDLKR